MTEGRRHTVLVADDEPDIREVLRLYLENAGYHVMEVRDGEEALRVLESEPVDLCLLDIMMPGLSGYEVLGRLRRERPTPVVLISAKGQDAEKVIGLDLGADDYLVKPFNPLEAVARANSLMRRVYDMDARPLPSDGGREAPVSGGLRVSRTLVVRELELDLDGCRLSRSGEEVELTPVELRIMELFM